MTGAEAVQAVADMSRERERDFDTMVPDPDNGEGRHPASMGDGR